MRSVVHKAFHQIRGDRKDAVVPQLPPGVSPTACQRRDFLYVKDAVKMTVHLAELDAAGGLFNIGAGESRTWLDLAHALFAAMGREPEIEFIDMPEACGRSINTPPAR